MNIDKVISKSFYGRETSVVAKELLGKILIRKLKIVDSAESGNYKDTDYVYIAGKIVETEAYLPENDEASHQYKGKTKRNEILFGEPGFTYVYSIHRYHCLNISTEPSPIAGCVLIRAIEPLEGIELMKKNRGVKDLRNLVNGPGKICQALNINRDLNGIDVTANTSSIFIVDRQSINNFSIQATPRIGISKAKELLLRFVIY